MQGYDIYRYIDLMVLVVALVGSVVVGAVLSRKNKNDDAFFMARSAMPGWAVGLSFMATIISSMTFLALPAYSYKADWRWMAACIAYPLALIPAIKWFMPYFRGNEVRSAYDHFEQRFGPWARVYMAMGFVLTQGFRSGIILDATALGLDALVGIPYMVTLASMGTAVIIYCALGGLEAVIWTDVIQGIGLIVGGALVIPIVCLHLPGGAGQLVRDAVSEGKTSLGPMTLSWQELSFWTILVSHLVLYTQWFCTDQMFVQRYCSPKTMREARSSLHLSMLTTVPVWVYFIVVGTAIWAFYRHFPDSAVAAATAEEAFPHFIATTFPLGLSGIFATAMCLAAMPSSSVNAAAATIATDFYRRFAVKLAAEPHYLVAGRVFTVLFGAAVVGIALIVHGARTTTLIELQAVMLGIFGSGLLGLFLLGFATQTSNQAAAIATAATIVLVLAWLASSRVDAIRDWLPHELWLGVVANVFLFSVGLCWERGRRWRAVLRRASVAASLMPMIVDVHTHLSTLDQWGPVFRQAFSRAHGSRSIDLHVTPDRHQQAMAGVDTAIVFGINSIALKMATPNEAIAEYARAHPGKIIGFMSVDPHDPSAVEQVDYCHKELGLRGIKMSPVYQDYHPCDDIARRVHRRAEQLGLPILTHAAFHSISTTRMEWAKPLLYDEVAREFPNLRIILAHIGLPWFQDAMVMVYKHPHVYADVSPAMHQGWLYQALAAFQEFRVMHKLLFGSDFPVATPEQVRDSLRNINRSVSGTGLPHIDSGLIEELIHRDSLGLLGLR